MTTATTYYSMELEAVERLRARAPYAVRLAEVLYTLARAALDRETREALEAIGWQVEGWANEGHDVNGPEAVRVIETALATIARGRS
jgi:hypothetical protein